MSSTTHPEAKEGRGHAAMSSDSKVEERKDFLSCLEEKAGNPKERP